MQKLKGKTILFTGAFGLIGKEICTHYMHEGARVKPGLTFGSITKP